MRRMIALILCLLMLSTTAYAENAAASAQSGATVSTDGSCHITISLTVRLESAASSDVELRLGPDVSGVRLNGSTASLRRSGGITSVKLTGLTKGITGTIPITVSYTANSIVTTDENGKQTVTVPLLYGFTYPVESMSFNVTLPNAFDAAPSFISGYHEQDIETNITHTVNGATVSGTVNTSLKDHETLFMTITAPEGVFPHQQAAGGTLQFNMIAMIVCASLCLLYWLGFMSCLPRFPIRRSTAPAGINAGILGCYLVGKGADLSLMAIHWAQLGYLIIHLDEHGRVILYKKMDMGNERSGFEARCFNMLFSKGPSVDATGYRYARICEKAALLSLKHGWGLKPKSGNPRILRVLSCLVSLFAGIAMGDCITTSPAWRVIWMFLFALFAAVLSWYMQEGMSCLHLNQKTNLFISLGCLGCGAVLLILGAVSGCIGYTACAVAANLLFGLAAAYTGRRTDMGNQVRDEIFGLRRYMQKVSKPELMRILRTNTDYYYELAPFALALGVDKQFAARFGNLQQSTCIWLTTGMDSASTATEWYPLLREAYEAMTVLQNRPPWEKLLNSRFGKRL